MIPRQVAANPSSVAELGASCLPHLVVQFLPMLDLRWMSENDGKRATSMQLPASPPASPQHLPSISPASLSLHGSEIPASWVTCTSLVDLPNDWISKHLWFTEAPEHFLSSWTQDIPHVGFTSYHTYSYLIYRHIIYIHLSPLHTSAFCSSAAQVLFMMWTRRVLWLLRLSRFLVLLVVLLWTCTLDQSRHVLTRAPRSTVKHSQTSLHTALRLEMAWDGLRWLECSTRGCRRLLCTTFCNYMQLPTVTRQDLHACFYANLYAGTSSFLHLGICRVIYGDMQSEKLRTNHKDIEK